MGFVSGLKVIAVEPVFFEREFWLADADIYVTIFSKYPSVRFTEVFFSQDCPDRSARAASGAVRAVEVFPGSPKPDVHEIVVQFRRKLVCGENLFTGLSARPIRAWMSVAFDQKIQRNCPKIGGEKP